MTNHGNGARGEHSERFDALVVGAGFGGLYALHRLRRLGLSVRVLEAAPDIGGTWYWNAYPGARCDVESMDYSYSFSPELDQEWTWTELYPSQPEILEYINHVADRFDLRPHFELNTTVKAAAFNEKDAGWELESEDGRTFNAQFCVFATGCLSAPLKPRFDGVEDFGGEWYMTQQWPREPVDLNGKSVAVIGTGSSAVQSVPEIAKEAAEIKVFQRTPNFSVPGRNRALTEEEIRERKVVYQEYREEQRRSAVGVIVPVNTKSALEMTEEEQRAELERCWSYGGCGVFNGVFADTVLNLESNQVVQEFIREKIREIVDDPELAEKLCPTGYPFAAKRLCVDNGYFETFNRENVSLVDIKDNPIERITSKGIELSDGEVHEVDVIVYAMGFDAISGALLRVDIRGRGNSSLREEWAEGPRSYLGLAMANYPNLFTVTGPGSPSVLAVMIAAIEQHVDWIGDCIAYVRRQGYTTVEAATEAQEEWTGLVHELAAQSVFPLASSYYMGANVPGKPRVFPIYIGGLGDFRQKCEAIAADDYEGFTFGKARSASSVRSTTESTTS